MLTKFSKNLSAHSRKIIKKGHIVIFGHRPDLLPAPMYKYLHLPEILHIFRKIVSYETIIHQKPK
jgi:hypothetical protein